MEDVPEAGSTTAFTASKSISTASTTVSTASTNKGRKKEEAAASKVQAEKKLTDKAGKEKPHREQAAKEKLQVGEAEREKPQQEAGHIVKDKKGGLEQGVTENLEEASKTSTGPPLLLDEASQSITTGQPQHLEETSKISYDQPQQLEEASQSFTTDQPQKLAVASQGIFGQPQKLSEAGNSSSTGRPHHPRKVIRVPFGAKLSSGTQRPGKAPYRRQPAPKECIGFLSFICIVYSTRSTLNMTCNYMSNCGD